MNLAFDYWEISNHNYHKIVQGLIYKNQNEAQELILKNMIIGGNDSLNHLAFDTHQLI